jgi:hypothetical protein
LNRLITFKRPKALPTEFGRTSPLSQTGKAVMMKPFVWKSRNKEADNKLVLTSKKVYVRIMNVTSKLYKRTYLLYSQTRTSASRNEYVEKFILVVKTVTYIFSE